MIDPTYVTQATTWLVVWAAAGTATRQWIAGQAASKQSDEARKASTR